MELMLKVYPFWSDSKCCRNFSGKNYTTATIDVEAITGILGAGLTGSGAELEVVIPASGTGASIFTEGDKVGRLRNLRTITLVMIILMTIHYVLRLHTINAQLTSTSILDSITVTDPGSGYSQAPAVVITGGGGTGAVAEATIKNGRLDQIIVKDQAQVILLLLQLLLDPLSTMV